MLMIDYGYDCYQKKAFVCADRDRAVYRVSALAAGVVELGFRSFYNKTYEMHFGSSASYRLDKDLIYEFEPSSYYVYQQAADMQEIRDINAFGIRDDDVNSKDPDVYRLMAVGDSYTYGHGVPRQQSFPNLLEQILGKNIAGRQFEVINAGVPGYNMDQEYRFFTSRLLELKPDFVILALEEKDILVNNVLYTYEGDELIPYPGWKNWIYFQTKLYLDAPQWLKKSYFFDYFVHVLRDKDPFWLVPYRDPVKQKEWQAQKIRRMVKDLKRLAEEHGFELYIFVFPSQKALVHGGNYSVYEDLGEEGNRIMKQLIKDINAEVRVFNAMDAFLALNLSTEEYNKFYFQTDSHLSPEGNAWLAALLFEDLVNRDGRIVN